jgi:hypothetical protein
LRRRYRNATFVLGACLLLAAGFLAGIVFQKAIGAGRLLRAAGIPSPWQPGASPPPQPASETGLPDELWGRLSLFILAGQSNMSGRGAVPSPQPRHPRIFAFGNDYRWKPALEPLDDARRQVDEVSADLEAGFGPGLSFALALAEQRPDLTIALIPCAKGNTTIEEWRSSPSDATLYGSCLKRVDAASRAGELAGVLFFQGEADALNPVRYPLQTVTPHEYADRFSTVIRDLRRDLSAPKLPLVFAQIGTHAAPGAFTNWETVRAQQQAVRIPCSTMITTADLPLSDGVHFTTDSYRIIGRRFASAYLSLTREETCR